VAVQLRRAIPGSRCDGLSGDKRGSNPLRAYTYGFDVAGNRTSQALALNGGAPTMTSYTYDAAGRMTSDGTNSYEWDRADRLLSMGTSAYQYNGLGQRVQQAVGIDVTKYLLDQQPGLFQVLAETTNGETTRHVFDPLGGLHAIQQSSGAWQYPIRDGLGSVKAISDASGAILRSTQYAPYGEQTRFSCPISGVQYKDQFGRQMGDSGGG
jgi:hypothetical protein